MGCAKIQSFTTMILSSHIFYLPLRQDKILNFKLWSIKNKFLLNLSNFCFLYFICLRYYLVVASLQIIIS